MLDVVIQIDKNTLRYIPIHMNVNYIAPARTVVKTSFKVIGIKKIQYQ